MSHEIDVQIDEELITMVSTSTIVDAASRTLATAQVDEPVEVSIMITGDALLHELNRTYRGQDKSTDVLSFGQDEADIPSAPGLPRLLGDVVISYPRVVAQAAQAGWTPQDELAWLVIHGVLHLLGYDDEDEDGRAEMWRLGEQVLGKPAPMLPDEIFDERSDA